MKKYKDLSVKVKVPVMMGVASLAVLALVCLLLLKPLRTASLGDASQIARLSASSAAGTMGERINRVAGLARSWSGSIEKLLSSGRSVRQEKLLADLHSMFEYQVAADNLWCIFEPGLFGVSDSLGAGRQATTPDGAFVPWLVNGKEIHDAANRVSAYPFDAVKREGREIITEPYKINVGGKEKQVFSICVPIRAAGRYVGVIGTDFDIADFNRVLAGINSERNGKLITDKGTVVLHYDEARIGTQAEYGNREILDKLADGKPFEGMYRIDGADIYKVYLPVQLGAVNKAWFYAMDVPREEIYRNARSTAFYLIVYCIIGVALIGLAGWFLVRPLLNNVSGVTGIIRRLSLGHIDMEIEKNRSADELGVMTGELEQLVDGLKRTADFAHNIGDGNLDAEYRLLSDGDKLGNSLLEMRESLRKADSEQTIRAKEEEQRNWITAGLAKFAEILRRDNNDMEALSYNVISNMVKYIGINQGGIFILNEVEKVLEMKACYAFDRRKFAEKTISPGEGLVGTCLQEGETIYMTDIPNEYISITSGLGDANPRALLISPLKVNEEIFGVIELASFTAFEPYQLEFVQKVSESIAATISTVTVNIRTNKLLEQTKLQAEEMANQEEELRQNMEEMQATQEESRRREEELQETLVKMQEVQAAGAEKEHEMMQFHSAIFESNNVIEFTPEGFITEVNPNFRGIFGNIPREAAVGKHMSEFAGEEAFRAVQVVFEHGKKYENVQMVTVGSDKRIIRQKFMPLTDRDGKVLKVMMLGFDETHIEEIRQQEEELRQNMEEMQATQEESRRREEELQHTLETVQKMQTEGAEREHEMTQFHDMIFGMFNMVEFSADAIITDVNQNLINLFGNVKKADFIGKPLAALIGEDACKAAWAKLNRGEYYEDIQTPTTEAGSTARVHQKFMPILDRNGKLQKVMMVGIPEDK